MTQDQAITKLPQLRRQDRWLRWMSSCGKTQPAIHAASCQSLEVASGSLVTSRFKLYLHLFFVVLVLRRCCALVLGEPRALQKAAAVEGCTPNAACRRHHMSALLRLLSAGEASAAGSSWTSFAASCMLSVAPCLEMTCRQATTML